MLTTALTATGLGFAVYSLSAPAKPLPATSPAASPVALKSPPAIPAPAPPSGIVSPQAVAPLPPIPPPDVHATSAILIDAVSGQVLYERNADAELPMASTTKVMTALLFCERVRDTDVITASKNACDTHDSSIHLQCGEKVSGNDMLHAILMRSANDGCVAAAEHISGSESAFVDLMNERAISLGAMHTHFVNSHGLPASNHYTTARDLAIIARAAMQEPRIRDVVRTRYYVMKRSLNKQDVHLRNHSHFLGYFPGADGVKTGWTHDAGHCYVGSATWGKWQLIAVVLHSPNYVHETSALMKYGFFHFQPNVVAQPGETVGLCSVRDGERPTISVTAKDPVQVVTRKGQAANVDRQLHLLTVAAPIRKGAVVGTLDADVDGKTVDSSPLLAAEDDRISTEAQAAHTGGSPWRRMAFATTILATGLVSLRYGTRFGARYAALTKSARRRRRRLAQSLRSSDRLG